MSVGSCVERAITLLSSAPIDALELLLDVWPHARDTGLAEQIDRIDRFLAPAFLKLPHRNRDQAWETRWAERSLAETGYLLRCIDGRGRFERLRSIQCMSADPRTTGPILDLLEGHLGNHDWYAAGETLVRTGDPRTRTRLLAKRSEVPTRVQGHIDRILRDFPVSKPVSSTALRQAVDALLQRPPPVLMVRDPEASERSDSLLRALFDMPHDPGPVRIWADVLHEAGDPLGVFVSLQLDAAERALTVDEAKELRRASWEAKHRLLGVLDGVLEPDSVWFQRALPTSAKVVSNAMGSTANHASWRLFRQIETSAEHLSSGALPNVRRFGACLVESDQSHFDAPCGYARLKTQAPDLERVRSIVGNTQIRAVSVRASDASGLTEAEASWLYGLDELHIAALPSLRPQTLAASLAPFDLDGLRTVPRLVLERVPGSLMELWQSCSSGGELVVMRNATVIEISRVEAGLVVNVGMAMDTPVDRLCVELGALPDLFCVRPRRLRWAPSDSEALAEKLPGVRVDGA